MEVQYLHELEEAIEQYPLLLDAPIALTIADPTLPDCPLFGCSQGFTKLTGYTEKEILGKNCRFLNNNCDIPLSTRTALRNVVKTQDSIVCIVENARKDGSKFRNLLYMTPFRCEEWQKTYMLGLQADVSNISLPDAQTLQASCDSKISTLFKETALEQWIKVKAAHFEAFDLMYLLPHLPEPPSIDDLLDRQNDQKQISSPALMSTIPGTNINDVCTISSRKLSVPQMDTLQPLMRIQQKNPDDENEEEESCSETEENDLPVAAPKWLVEEQIWCLLPSTLPQKLEEMQEYNKAAVDNHRRQLSLKAQDSHSHEHQISRCSSVASSNTKRPSIIRPKIFKQYEQKEGHKNSI